MLDFLIVDEGKLTSHNAELRLTYNFLCGSSIRYSDAFENIIFVIVIRGGLNERVNSELIALFTAIYDEVGSEKHEISEFIPLSSETSHDEFED